MQFVRNGRLVVDGPSSAEANLEREWDGELGTYAALDLEEKVYR